MIDRLEKLFWKKQRPSQHDDITLSDIIRGLQYCVNQSKEIASLQYVTEFRDFLDDEDKPYVQTVRINENTSVDVPLLCMLNHEALKLDEMEVDLDITVKNMSLKIPDPVFDDDKDSDKNKKNLHDKGLEYLSRTAFAVDLNSAKLEGGYTKLGLKLKFKSGSPPESVSRIIESLNGEVSTYLYPVKMKEEKEK